MDGFCHEVAFVLIPDFLVIAARSFATNDGDFPIALRSCDVFRPRHQGLPDAPMLYLLRRLSDLRVAPIDMQLADERCAFQLRKGFPTGIVESQAHEPI